MPRVPRAAAHAALPEDAGVAHAADDIQIGSRREFTILVSIDAKSRNAHLLVVVQTPAVLFD